METDIAELRLRIAEIDRKYPLRQDSAHPPTGALHYVEDWLGGEVVETRLGRHFEAEKLYESHRYHGSADIGALADLPHDLLDTISGGEIRCAPAESWAFLDTETTGAMGAGPCAFLVGVGRITPAGFRVRQFFMREYSEEPSLLHALGRHLASFQVMITYNGRAFDQPLLESRYRFAGVRQPFSALGHVDLLHGARRLWKLRFESCRLVDLENRVLGVERQGDVPGALIPSVYFEYLRTRQAARLLPVFHHNAVDILSLACLTGIVPYAFKDPGLAGFRHGAEMAGIARWLAATGELEQARTLFRRAVEAGLRDGVLFQSLWDLAALERKLGAEAEALAIWSDLSSARNAFQGRALEALAKHHEHRSKDCGQALALTRAARELDDSMGLRKREARLMKQLTTRDKMKPRAKRKRNAAH